MAQVSMSVPLSGVLWAFLAVVAAALGSALWRRTTRTTRTTKMPTRWRRVGVITQVYVYPLKSGQGISVSSADCTLVGLGVEGTGENRYTLRDRVFLVFGEHSLTMRTARQHPIMVLIKVTSEDGLTYKFEAPGMSPLSLTVPDGSQKQAEKKTCKLWTEEVETLDCGDDVAEWMSMYLLKVKSGLRVGYYADDVLTRRDLSKTNYLKYYSNLRSTDSGAYSDLATFMLMNEASVSELKSRLAPHHPGLSPLWFRPNFVVHGCGPFEEDKWDWIRIGETAVFQNVKPCTRCVMVNVDPETGIKDSNLEILKTLKSYRQLADPALMELEGDSPAIGLYLGLRQPGVVQAGDSIYVGSD